MKRFFAILMILAIVGCGAGSENGNNGSGIAIKFEPEGNLVAGNKIPLKVTVEKEGGGNIPSINFSLTKGKGKIDDPNTIHPVLCPDEAGEYCVKANAVGMGVVSKYFWVSPFQASSSPKDGSVNVPRNVDLVLTGNGNNMNWDVYVWNLEGDPIIAPKIGITTQVVDLGVLGKGEIISYQVVAHNGKVIFPIKSDGGQDVCHFTTAQENSPPYISKIEIKGGGTYLVEGDEPEFEITAADVDPNDVITYGTSLISSPLGSNVHLENENSSKPKLKGITAAGEYGINVVVENTPHSAYQRDFEFEIAPLSITEFSPADPNMLVSLRPEISFAANATGNAVLWLSESFGADFSTNAEKIELGSATSYQFDHDLKAGTTYFVRIDYTHGTVTKWFPSTDTEWKFTTMLPEPVNHVPTITSLTASKTEFLINEEVTLQVAATDADGDTLKYTWSIDQDSLNKSGTFSDPSKAITKFSAASPGNVLILCQVGDSNIIASKTLLITVKSAAVNHKPISVITLEGDPNRYIYAGDTVRINGRLSSDSDNDPLTHRWELQAKPDKSTAMISNPNCVDASIIPDFAGDYIMRHTVTDGKETSDPSQLFLHVQAITQIYLRNFKPAYDDANVPLNAVSTWDSNGVAFDIYFSADPNSLAMVSSKQAGKSYAFQGLQQGIQYFYQVVAYETVQSVTPVFGPIVKFRTIPAPPEVTEWKGENVILTKKGLITFNNIYNFFGANGKAALDRSADIYVVGDIIGWGIGFKATKQNQPLGIKFDLAEVQTWLRSRGQSFVPGPNRANFVVVENGTVVDWLQLHMLAAADKALFVKYTVATSPSGAGDMVFTWDFYEPTAGNYEFGPVKEGEIVVSH